MRRKLQRKCRKMLLFTRSGRVAQLGEHLLCKQGVAGSIPVTSTTFLFCSYWRSWLCVSTSECP